MSDLIQVSVNDQRQIGIGYHSWDGSDFIPIAILEPRGTEDEQRQCAEQWAKSVNAFAALAEHLGCKPEDLNVDLVQWYEALRALYHAEWMVDPSWTTGDKRNEVFAQVEQALAQFDTVDRADKE